MHKTLLRVRGKGGPPRLSGERVELLLILQEGHTRWVNSPPKFSPRYPVEEDVEGWRVLGWRLPSGDLRHGDYDVVDPDLAEFDRLPVPSAARNLGHSMGAFAPGTTMR